MAYLFTSESVSEGHPDKVADQISDALLDQFLAYDEHAHCAIESFCTTGQVVIMGEVRSNEYVDLQTIARKTIKNIGYTKSEYQFDGDSCGVLTAIHEQSDDINRGVSREEDEDQGAGDQGMMFGYATNETDNYMPVSLDLAQLIMKELAAIRKEGKVMTYLRPDSKSQVTVEYSDDNIPQRIDTIVVSTQHSKDITQEEIKELIMNEVIKPCIDEKYLDENTKYFINPSGSFVVGGSWGDSGTTGRKIVCDTYGGRGRIGGGCFSSKDPTKVDRSAAYYSRYVAKNIVANGLARRCEVEVAYAIGKAQPVSLCVDTFGTGKFDDEKLLEIVKKNFNFEVGNIISELDLRKPVYHKTSCYGHFGDPQFTWEKVKKLEY